MIHPLDHYQTTLNALTSREEKCDFDLKVSFILKRYMEEDAKPKIKKCIPGSWSSFIKTTDTSAIDAIADEYYKACGMSDAEKRAMLRNDTNMQITDETTPITFETTNCCESPEIVLLSEYAVCSKCGEKVTESNQYSANYTDASISPNKTVAVIKSNANEKNKLLMEFVLRIQGLKTSAITKKDWTRIYEEVTNGIDKEQLHTISHARVDRVLHELKLSKYYPDTPIIWETITGNALKPIPDGALWVINHVMSPQLSSGTIVFTKEGVQVEERKRTYGKSFLCKALELCRCDEFLHLLVIQKGDDTLRNLNTIWQKYCDQAGWKFYPS